MKNNATAESDRTNQISKIDIQVKILNLNNAILYFTPRIIWFIYLE